MEELKQKNRTTLHSITSYINNKSNNSKIKLLSFVEIASKQSINHSSVSEQFLASHRINVFEFLKKVIKQERSFSYIFQEKPKKTSLLQIKGEECRSVVWQDEQEEKNEGIEQKYITEISEIDEILEEKDIGENNEEPLQRSEPKKLSIVFDLSSSYTESQSSFLISENSFNYLSVIKLPQIEFTPEIFQKIFHNTDLFGLNMSICLLLKLLYISQIILTNQNVACLLCIANMVGYKMHEDIQVNNFPQLYSQVLSISVKEVIDLEKWFLYLIQYRTLISKQQYQSIIEKLKR